MDGVLSLLNTVVFLLPNKFFILALDKGSKQVEIVQYYCYDSTELVEQMQE